MDYNQNTMQVYYVPKVKMLDEAEWKNIDTNGCLYGRYGQLSNQMKFDSALDATGWLRDTLTKSHEYAKFISKITDETSRNVIYGWVEATHKKSSLFMRFVDSKLNDNHDQLVAKTFEVPNIKCKVVKEVVSN